MWKSSGYKNDDVEAVLADETSTRPLGCRWGPRSVWAMGCSIGPVDQIVQVPFSQLRDAWYDATKWPIARGTTEGSATQQAYKVYGRPSCGLWDVPHVVCLLLG